MLRVRPEARVGLVIFFGILALIGAYWFLGGTVFRTRTYTIYAIFRDVQRLDRGASVRMAGVRVGQVTAIALTPDSRARVEMAIRQDIKIPRKSVFRITSGGLVGDVYVDVIPSGTDGNVRKGDTVQGEDAVTLDRLIPQASELLAELQKSAQSLNSVLGDKRMLASMRRTMMNAEEATGEAAELAREFRLLAAQNKDEIDVTLRNAAKASADFAVMAEKMKGVLARGGDEDIKATLESGRVAAENLRQASEKLRQLVSDEQLTGDIKATVSNLRKTSENAVGLSEKLGKILGTRQRGERAQIRGEGTTVDFLANLRDNRYRVDYNITRPLTGNRFYRLGIFGLGDSARANFQLGQAFDSDLALRYGLYASRLGVGVDKYLSNRTSVHADLYDINDLHLELKGRYTLSEDYAVWAGMDDLLDDRSLLLGVQYRK